MRALFLQQSSIRPSIIVGQALLKQSVSIGILVCLAEFHLWQMLKRSEAVLARVSKLPDRPPRSLDRLSHILF